MSCKYFSGFTTIIDVDEIDNINQIIKIIKKELKINLQKLNLYSLIGILDNISTYHIHDFKFGDILLNNRTFFICSCC